MKLGSFEINGGDMNLGATMSMSSSSSDAEESQAGFPLEALPLVDTKRLSTMQSTTSKSYITGIYVYFGYS